MDKQLNLQIDELESIKLNYADFWTAFGIGAGAGTILTATAIVARTLIVAT